MLKYIGAILTLLIALFSFAVATSSRLSVVETRQSEHEKVVDRIHLKLDSIDKYIRNK